MNEERARPTTIRSAALWFGLLAPPIAWGVRLVVAYGMEDLSCSAGSSSQRIFGFPIATAAIAESIVMFGLCIAAGLVALSLHRRLRNEPAPNRAGWMAFSGICSSVVFSILIVTETAPLFVLDVCVQSL